MTVAGEGGRPIRVFLLDEHEVVRRGLRELIEDEPDIEVEYGYVDAQRGGPAQRHPSSGS